MLEGICPECGSRYYGWALRNPRYQMCSKCGIALDITEDGQKYFQGYSPFTAEQYSMNLTSDVPESEDIEDIRL